jgi:hypothetical protein
VDEVPKISSIVQDKVFLVYLRFQRQSFFSTSKTKSLFNFNDKVSFQLHKDKVSYQLRQSFLFLPSTRRRFVLSWRPTTSKCSMLGVDCKKHNAHKISSCWRLRAKSPTLVREGESRDSCVWRYFSTLHTQFYTSFIVNTTLTTLLLTTVVLTIDNGERHLVILLLVTKITVVIE